MSRLAPDIPELHRVPEAARSLVYMSALDRAIRSGLTWLTGAVVLAVAVGIGASQGTALFGGLGGIVGAAAGASPAVWCRDGPKTPQQATLTGWRALSDRLSLNRPSPN